MKIRVAGIICVSGKLLTMRYNYGGEDVYAIPGGNLEFGEEMKVGLVREFLEELQIEISVKEDVLVAEVHTETNQTIHQLFECEINSGEPMINPDETKALEVCWLEIDNLSIYNLYPAVGKQINAWLENNLNDKYVGVIEQKWY